MKKKFLLGLFVVLVVIQFFRPEKNNSNDQQYHLSTKYVVPGEVVTILEGACNDCHSNLTKYPWYANIQPVAWWLADHVREGKQHLNFSNFTSRKVAVQNHKFEEIVEMVEKKGDAVAIVHPAGLAPGGKAYGRATPDAHQLGKSANGYLEGALSGGQPYFEKVASAASGQMKKGKIAKGKSRFAKVAMPNLKRVSFRTQ